MFCRHSDRKLDLDSSNKLRIYRIKNFALWLANESNLSLIKMRCVGSFFVLRIEILPRLKQHLIIFNLRFSKTELGEARFNAAITGSQPSNELIIQQLEELLKNDGTLSQQGDSRFDKKSSNRFSASGTKNKFAAGVASSSETIGGGIPTTCTNNILTG